MSSNSKIEALMRGLGKGASLGTADEAAPYGRNALEWMFGGPDDPAGIPREYAAGSPEADMTATMRADDAAAQAAYPTSFMIGQVAGGLPSAIAAGGAAKYAPTVASEIAASGLLGGARAGLEGAGNADDGDRLKGAAQAAGPGALLSMAGAGAPVAVKAVKDLFKGGPPPGGLAPAYATAGGAPGRAANTPKPSSTGGAIMQRAGDTVPPPKARTKSEPDAPPKSEHTTTHNAVNPPKGYGGQVPIPKDKPLPKIPHFREDQLVPKAGGDAPKLSATNAPPPPRYETIEPPQQGMPTIPPDATTSAQRGLVGAEKSRAGMLPPPTNEAFDKSMIMGLPEQRIPTELDPQFPLDFGPTTEMVAEGAKEYTDRLAEQRFYQQWFQGAQPGDQYVSPPPRGQSLFNAYQDEAFGRTKLPTQPEGLRPTPASERPTAGYDSYPSAHPMADGATGAYGGEFDLSGLRRSTTPLRDSELLSPSTIELDTLPPSKPPVAPNTKTRVPTGEEQGSKTARPGSDKQDEVKRLMKRSRDDE